MLKGSYQAVAAVLAMVLGLTMAYDLENLPPRRLNTPAAQELFADYVVKYGKRYEMTEVPRRLGIFKENVNWMIKFNADPENTHWVGINQFADLRPEEWSQFTGLRPPAGWEEPDFGYFDQLPEEETPDWAEIADHPRVKADADKLDWTIDEKDEAGKVKHVKATLPIRNQGSCGSCYSFSAMATMEALYRINYWDKIEKWAFFSPQQGVDCTGPRYGNSYCSGGWMTSVFRWIIDNKGVCWDANYPYQNRQGSCRSSQCKNAFVNSGYREISGQAESTLLKHLAINPLAIAVTSGTREFMYYRGGVLTYCGNAVQPDHAVTAVGYDKTGTTPWVKIRNSWGPQWGEQGHIRFLLGNNTCRWRSNVSYPTISGVKDGLPETLVDFSESEELSEEEEPSSWEH